MYLIDRFSHLLRCEVALHFVNTWDINVLTFNYHWKQLQLPVWIDYQALAALHAHRLQIPYWAFQELVVSWILSLESVDYFRTSDYFSGWKKDQSLSAKLWGLYLKTRIEDWGLRIGIGDQRSVIPEKGRKIRILPLLYKKFDPNNHFLYFIDHFPLLF